MREIEHQPPDTIDWRIPAALLLAFWLHNLEEAFTFNGYREASQNLVRNLTSSEITFPSHDIFLIALTAVSLAAALSMVWAILQPSLRSSLVLVQGLAWIMLLNVFLPHVPASILMGGYAPGVVTAVLVNLPIAVFALLRLRSFGQHKQKVR